MFTHDHTFNVLPVLNAIPGKHLILLADSPRFTIVGATDSYLHNTYKTREGIIGKSLFEVFPDNPEIADATGAKNLRQSLDYVIEYKALHQMEDQRYDVFNAEKGIFEFKVWRPINKAVPDTYGEVQYIIHSVDDVTGEARMQEEKLSIEATRKIEESEERLRSLIKAAPLGIVLFVGRELIVQMPNQSFIDIIGKDDSIIGKPLAEAMPELEGQPFLQILDNVYTSGKIYETFETKVKIMNNGVMKQGYYDFSYTPLFDVNGNVYAILDVSVDVTERVLARKALEESEKNLRSTILQAPVAMCIFRGPEYVVEIANERMFEFWGKKENALLQRPIFEGLPEVKNQGFEELLHKVYCEGETVSANEVSVTLPRNGKIEPVFVNFVYQPFKEGDGAISGVMAVAIDVTEQVLARKKIEESEYELQLRVKERTAEIERQKAFTSGILEASFSGIYSIIAIRNEKGNIEDFRYLFVNNITARILKMSVMEVVGRTVLELIPENRTNGFFEMFCRVLQTGEAIRNETNFISERFNQWFDYAIVPMDSETLVVTVQDITKQKIAALQIEQQRNLLNSILEHSPTGISVTEIIRDEQGEIIDGRTILANAISEKLSGIPVDTMLAKKISENDPKILQSPLFKMAINTLHTGEPFVAQYFLEPTRKWLELSVAKMDKDRLINVFSDVTILKNAHLRIEESEERLRAVFNSAQAGMFTFTPVQNHEGEIIDFRFVITNANFANYVGQTPEVLNGALGSTWFPGYLHNGVFDMYKKTYLTGETLRIDIHYNVDQHDIFLDLKSTKVGGEVLVTFTDYTPLKRAQVQLEKYLEDLKRSNASLEEFAYAASHDMKEPIRKILVFTARLKERLKEKLADEDLKYFQRLETSAQRMGKLIDDLLEFSHVANENSVIGEVNLNKKVSQALEDLELEIAEKNAIIIADPLPTIMGHKRQMQQLFQNLISNALKFSKPGIAPHVHISAKSIKGSEAGLPLSGEDNNKNYYLLEVSDNGIGFEQHYAERIFNMFQRLHGKAEYDGTGIGLSIVRKVVYNHKGYIWAEGNPGEGARFKVLLPKE